MQTVDYKKNRKDCGTKEHPHIQFAMENAIVQTKCGRCGRELK